MRILRRVIILVISCFTHIVAYGQQRTVEQIVDQVIHSYNNKDSLAFNALLNKELGLYFITTLGVNNRWTHTSKISFNHHTDCSINNPYQDFLAQDQISIPKSKNITYSDRPFFECETIYKKGVFVANKGKYHTLSESIIFYRTHYSGIIGEEITSNKAQELDHLYSQVKRIENQSRRIIVNSDTGTFIFYITKIDTQWWLTMIDFASADCSV
ncbi:hypothetical protein OHD16_20600 [Sphingobacterium sp. ML3W]|uniref:hypothetical protein n=1 Tax=Sphingobacterium sp. ML3W TaxID=1538644 RepID=UPI00249BAAC4|nr:hypothetical protein [Sphingobacterium sp. ML3W]WFA82362.1 hypothetical protein OGI71_13740 [Sphingobacterium sp. ML3W]